ncbi:hypothetical protein KDW_48130 [Dictyobacter vulcani]|uniref:Uncharacterized protein n=1 Tax=Dictyobacter vulcani TaxID=2607529 RepID=A0A5J4KVZ4_9CHLR|nr:hypothetical protein [Dictyobacter vulcani]GER90651.1 hypothetical protein KDW_48130 [Dictyobacter vulcani]
METLEPEIKQTPISELPAPHGIGMAVAFDWGLAVQTAFTPIYALFQPSNMLKIPGLSPVLGNILFFVVTWAVACGFAFFGEMIRSGRNWARTIQIVANILLSIVGIISLLNLYQSIRVGNFWPLVTEIILVIFSPLIVWRLTRSSTAQWFKHVTPAQARQRHGGMWVWFIMLWGLVGGILQTFAAMHK